MTINYSYAIGILYNRLDDMESDQELRINSRDNGSWTDDMRERLHSAITRSDEDMASLRASIELLEGKQ